MGKRFFWRAGLFLAATFTLAPSAYSQVNPDQAARAVFYHSGEFGDIALVDEARNPEDVRDLQRVRIFDSSEACYVVPQRDKFFFIINNRRPESVGRRWASFVTVVYHDPTDRDFVSLYRSGGWRDRRGQEMQPWTGNSDQQPELRPAKFIELHLVPPAQREAARRRFDAIASQFHGQLRQQPNVDSWDFYPNVAGPIRRRFRDAAALAASLHQYQITSSDRPERLVIVEVPRRGSTRFTLFVQTPGIDGESSTYERRFGTSLAACRRQR